MQNRSFLQENWKSLAIQNIFNVSAVYLKKSSVPRHLVGTTLRYSISLMINMSGTSPKLQEVRTNAGGQHITSFWNRHRTEKTLYYLFAMSCKTLQVADQHNCFVPKSKNTYLCQLPDIWTWRTIRLQVKKINKESKIVWVGTFHLNQLLTSWHRLWTTNEQTDIRKWKIDLKKFDKVVIQLDN